MNAHEKALEAVSSQFGSDVVVATDDLIRLTQLIDSAFREQMPAVYIESLARCVPIALARSMSLPQSSIIKRIKDWLHEHATDELDRSDLAAYLGCHPDHVTRLFREQLHSSFAYERKRLRCLRACDLLSVADASLADIAEACGFSSEQYFIRCFKQCYASTPRQWQRNAVNRLS